MNSRSTLFFFIDFPCISENALSNFLNYTLVLRYFVGRGSKGLKGIFLRSTVMEHSVERYTIGTVYDIKIGKDEFYLTTVLRLFILPMIISLLELRSFPYGIL